MTLAPSLRRLGLALLALLALVAGLIAWLNTDHGRAFLLARLLGLEFQSGLTIEIESLQGSLWRRAELRGLTIGDPKGGFLKAPVLTLDWQPLHLLSRNRLTITELNSPRITLLRLPELKPTDTPLLPDYDILINRLAIDALVLAPPVLGRREQLSLAGSADLRAGRARLDLTANSESSNKGGGDRLHLLLDAVPDANRLQLSADLDAPAGGTLTSYLKLDRPLTLRLRGRGDWTRWQGRLDASSGKTRLIGLDVANQKGLFSLAGTIAPAPLLSGTLAALLTELRLDASARLSGGPQEISLKLGNDSLRLGLRGRLTPDGDSIETGSFSADLLSPDKIAPQLVARNLRLAARLAGTLKDPLIDWALTADEAGWGDTGLTTLRGAGIIRPFKTEEGLALPFTLSAARLTGLPELAATTLQAPRLEGRLSWKDGLLTGNGLALRAAGLTGTADVRYQPATADYRLALNASAPAQPVPGVGLAAITADLLVRAAAKGPDITGKASARVTRLDNGAAASLLGGLPRLDTSFALAPDFTLTLTNLSLRAPALTLAGKASLSPTARLALDLAGTSKPLGPLSLSATGPAATPDLLLRLARPGLGIGLAAVEVRAQPVATGWSLALAGASTYGPVDARALLVTAAGPLSLRLDSAHAIGLTASGSATATPAGPFSGRLALTGTGLDGSLRLDDDAGTQVLALDLKARDASVASTTTPLLLERGDLSLILALRDTGPDANGSLAFIGFESESLRIDKGDVRLRYTGGQGQASLTASGTSGIPFSLETAARFSGNEIEITGKGQVDRQPLTLSNPARLAREGNDWVLAPVSLVAGQGRAELSGRIGDTSRLQARLEKLSLGLIAATFPRLDFSGTLSGTISLDLPENGTPRGRASLNISRLSRTGLASASLPINVALVADLGARGTVARAVLQRAGRTEGRAQLSLAPVPGGDASFLARLLTAPVKAMVRYNGPAQALWGLAGNDAIAVSGPVSLAADISGLLGEPQLSGTLGASRARMEATVLGAVIEDAAVEGRFNGSRLELTRFQGRVGKDGSVTGTGTVDLSAERSFPIDIRLEMKNAQLLNRDDFSGAGTGTMRIATDEYGGVVSGQLSIDRATYRLGRAAVADVPVLNVTERNARVLGRPQLAYAAPTRWLFNLQVKGDRRLFTSGMGLEAEWRANLKILGGATTPELNGRVELIRGDYDFAGRRFTLTKGDIRFQGGYPPDPLVDITAESTNSGFTALLAVNGTALKPAIRFSSVPQLPEDEVLSRLLFGESVTNLSAPEAVQLAGALGSLRGSGGFNPINSVRKGLGIDRLRILPADIATGRGTAVAAGQYIGRNVYVELATDAQGYTATNIEVSITRSLSILSQVATLGGIGGNLRWKRDY